ncbi:hypothetical protein EWM64_g8885 [Hericium alpestre]|uniref:Uncharacterized protein n=1 Tax=Hericium alpestre TaxID=135208 RepID=A0A4Y9ZK04_9AGAM|nr:hypothetical protein EWM64_g8885 [Hericium alpestre]
MQAFAAGRLHKSTPTSLLILPPSGASTAGILVSSGLDFTVHLTSIPFPPAPTTAKAVPAELTPATSLRAHRRGVTSIVAIDSPSQQLLSGSKDGTLRLWDMTGRQVSAIASNGLSAVNALALPDNNSGSPVVYTALQNGIVELFDMRTRASAGRTATGTPLAAVAASESAHEVVAGGTDGVVHIWDARSLGQERMRWRRSEGSIEGVAVLPSASPALSRVLVGGEDGLPYIAQVGSGGSEKGSSSVSVEAELVFGDVEAVRCIRVRAVEGGSEVWMSGDGGVARRYVV